MRAVYGLGGLGLCRACTVCSLCSGEATEAQAAPRSKSSSKCDDTDSTRVAHCVSRERKSFQELDFRSPPRPQLPSLPLPACAPVDVTACACDKCGRLPATSGQVPDVVVIRSVVSSSQSVTSRSRLATLRGIIARMRTRLSSRVRTFRAISPR